MAPAQEGQITEGASPLAEIPKEDAHLLQYFKFDHLPDRLKVASKPFCLMAQMVMETCSPSPERTECLRKLLEAKDCGVRAFLAKLVILALLVGALVPAPAFAIDSILKAQAKAEKERVKQASKGKAQALLTIKGVNAKGEKVVVACVWLARDGDWYRYQQVSDGHLVATHKDDVERIEGDVLASVPMKPVTVHVMKCNGEYCKPSETAFTEPAWPNR